MMQASVPHAQLGQIVLTAERACSALHELADAASDRTLKHVRADEASPARRREFMAQRLHAHAELLLLEAWGGTPESVRKTTRLIRQLLHTARPDITAEPVDDGGMLAAAHPTSAAIRHLDALDRAGRQAVSDRRPATASIRRHGRQD